MELILQTAGAVLISVLLTYTVTLVVRFARGSNTPFPKGPPTLPILGNIHQLPSRKAFLTFTEWGRTYGASSDGMLGLRIGPSSQILILNKWQQVRDLVDARGAKYSDRPYVPIVEFVVPPPGDMHMSFMGYGPQWRRARRTIAEFLKDSELEKRVPLQEAESTQMIHDLLRDADEGREKTGSYYGHVVRCFGAVILASVYGMRGSTYEPDGYLGRFFDTQHAWMEVLDQGAMPPLDILPFLKWFPDSLTPWKGWKSRAQAVKERQSSLYRDLFADARNRISLGKSQDTFVADLLEKQENNQERAFSQGELDYLAGFLMEGGSDTTAMTFVIFILAMAVHPEIQQQAQQEVDAAFGEDTLPSSVDSVDLPFLKACFMEILRWRPLLPTGLPHATSEDDTYRGFVIPKGTTIIMNVWAIHHDPDEYAQPDKFDPSRYLANKFGTSSNSAGEESMRRELYTFGAGRRVCAGQQMGEMSTISAMAKFLWAFNVVPADEKLDTSVETAFKDAVITGPKDFNVHLQLRGSARRAVIEREWKKADEYLRRYE